MNSRCRTPHKKAYRSERAAKCKAGHWHVGHVR